MKVREIKVLRPKTTKAAMNQAVGILEAIDNLTNKGENIMRNINNTKTKLEKLEKALVDYQNQLDQIEQSRSEWKKIYDDLLLNFQLTEAEIIELKSSLLREKISMLQKKAGLPENGKTFNV